jgi:group I intron endonuclease
VGTTAAAENEEALYGFSIKNRRSAMNEVRNLHEHIKGIYLIERITDACNGESVYYIGQARDIFARLNSHFTTPVGTRIDAAIGKYGASAFSFRILETVSKEQERNKKEREYIKRYIEKYGEAALYNVQTGGKSGHNAINIEAKKLDALLRQRIKNVFLTDISYSCNLIAEYFNVPEILVIKIRMPILKEKGIVYNKKLCRVVYVDTVEPITPWHGGILTRKQLDIFNSSKDEMDEDELVKAMNTTKSDLKEFKQEYSDSYLPAEEVCDMRILSNDN